jgi:2-hydroxy-6-oxonona-2,4-dienedioate hydrolase
LVSGDWAARWAASLRVEVDGRGIRYRAAGAGLPIILVHGLGVSADYWFRNGSALADRGFRVLAPDLPGFGRSEAGADAAEGPVRQAAALERWTETLGIGAAVYVGHSLSCQTVLELAAARPDRVRGLVLAGPTGAGSRLHRVRQLSRLAMDAPREDAALVATVGLAYLRAGPLRVLRTWWRGAGHDPLRVAPRVRAPCVVVVGTRDPIVEPAFARALTAGLPQGRLVWVEGGTHAVHHSRAAEFNDEVARFAAPLAASAADA